MSSISIADLPRLSNTDLYTKLTSSTTRPADIAIIDVRDGDHIGGHIKGSTWIPSKELDARLPELLRTLAGKKEVVFHCALSQQRGPSAALRYLRARGEKGADGDQRVSILKGGFGEWQEKYGEDANVTEAYDKNLWEYGGP